MRKRPGGGMPVAEYFVLPNGDIPSFTEDALYPFMKGDGKRYQGVHLANGTVIKLYDYQIPSRFQTGFRGTREALNENLVETILPFSHSRFSVAAKSQTQRLPCRGHRRPHFLRYGIPAAARA
jgi:hypothetical protein